jgi:cobalt-zinc-cadmium efflux system protein
MHALSAHVRVTERPLSACDALLATLNRLLQERYHIAHTTVQFECAGCDPNDLYCAWPSGDGAGHGHTHSQASDMPPAVHQGG